MTLRNLVISAIMLAACASQGLALDLASRDVVVPVVARTEGEFGSRWKTDLVVTNAARSSSMTPVTVFISYMTGGAVSRTITTTLNPTETRVYRDVLSSEFGMTSGFGLVRVSTGSATQNVIARARIYNTGSSAGEYGQGVPGIPSDALKRDHLMTGLSGVDGNRTNVGIANPWNIDANYTVSLYEPNGEFRGSYTTIIPARSVNQFNTFEPFGISPFDGATVRITSTLGVYAYASVVRNDTGDATFVPGSGIAVGNEALLPAVCGEPAPVVLAQPGAQPAEGWIVMLRPGTNAAEVSSALASRLGFTVKTVYQDAFKGFSADLTHEHIRDIRCEPTVSFIEQNLLAPIPPL